VRNRSGREGFYALLRVILRPTRPPPASGTCGSWQAHSQRHRQPFDRYAVVENYGHLIAVVLSRAGVITYRATLRAAAHQVLCLLPVLRVTSSRFWRRSLVSGSGRTRSRAPCRGQHG
jgi:hypothetical protein